MNHKRINMSTNKSVLLFICINRLGMRKRIYCSQSPISTTLFNATINEACLGRFRGLNSQLGNPERYASEHLNRPPDVIRLNLLMLIAPLHRNCGKLLNGEIFVAQVYFVMFNARRAAIAEYALHFLPGSLRAISRYARSFLASSFSPCCQTRDLYRTLYRCAKFAIVRNCPQLSQNFYIAMNERLLYLMCTFVFHMCCSIYLHARFTCP